MIIKQAVLHRPDKYAYYKSECVSTTRRRIEGEHLLLLHHPCSKCGRKGHWEDSLRKSGSRRDSRSRPLFGCDSTRQELPSQMFALSLRRLPFAHQTVFINGTGCSLESPHSLPLASRSFLQLCSHQTNTEGSARRENACVWLGEEQESVQGLLLYRGERWVQCEWHPSESCLHSLPTSAFSPRTMQPT